MLCANAVKSLVEYYDLWYVLATLGTTYAAHYTCWSFIKVTRWLFAKKRN